MTTQLFRNIPGELATGTETSDESVHSLHGGTPPPSGDDEIGGSASPPALLLSEEEHVPERGLAKGPEMFQAAEFLTQLRAAQTATLETFQREVLGSDGAWVERHLRNVRDAFSAEESVSLTDELLLRCAETRSFWTGAEGRLRECGRCEAPHTLPACLTSDSGVSSGVIVRLKIAGPDLPHPTAGRRLTPCERYQEDRVNKRLRNAGVPQRLAIQRLQRIDNPEVLPKARRAFEKVVSCLRDRVAMTLLIQGKLCREYGSALLAECAAAHAPSLMSVHVPTFVRSERVAMTTKTNAGLLPYATAEVLVLDGIEAMQLETKHWLDEILWLQESRRDQGLITILTTTILKPTLKDTFPGALTLFVEKKQ